ncbi:chaperonin 10-like protein [Lasiosphaeria ovina]|uniref:Chaperonin 10-like protein n=1 Tax=Lasiosphaeria ovina TaxID=92902 RepID=A0AAE0K4B6_9PEZI|nr:chaperonin 10-like protein [Lasiosphaeria ovina]
MATQTGITIAGPNQPYTVVDTIPRPTVGPKQALVKSLYVGLNPVEPFMQHSGILIAEFPAVIGSDTTAVVLEAGAECAKLRRGDYVFGCAPVGLNRFSPFQETFLVDEAWVFKKTARVGLEEGSTVGAGSLTAGLALIDGLKLQLPSPGTAAPRRDSWVVVMGGSGTVGQYAVQIAKLCGYKVLASSSPSKAEIARKAGADATFDNRAPLDEQLGIIERVTGGGQFGHVVDASAQAFELSIKALETIAREDKFFSTVDDWSEMNVSDSISVYRVQFGMLGRLDQPLGQHVTGVIAELVAAFEGHIETGAIRPLDYQLVPGAGWDRIIESIADLEAGKFTKKPVVKVQDE